MNLDNYFISVALAVAERSTDPSTHVGCVVVNEYDTIISTGYNNSVVSSDSEYYTEEKPMRYLLSVHAEMRALLQATESVRNCKIYVTHASCDNCLKHLISVGIKEIIYDKLFTNGKFMANEQLEASVKLTKASKIINRNVNGISFLDDLKNNGIVF